MSLAFIVQHTNSEESEEMFLYCTAQPDVGMWLRNVEYSILLVMSELSTVLCDRALNLWLQVHGHRVSMESCRGGAQAGRQLWHPLLDRGAQAAMEGGFFGLRHKTKEADGG